MASESGLPQHVERDLANWGKDYIDEMAAEETRIPVANIHDLKQKYGSKGIGLVLEAMVAELPENERNSKLAKIAGEISADLEFALRQVSSDV